MIRSEPLTGSAALDDAGATYRVIYQSTSGVADRLNQPIGVSGIIAFPTDPAPAGGMMADSPLLEISIGGGPLAIIDGKIYALLMPATCGIRC